ncbi:NAD(P)/FAD-dependent oxidoreductase [Salinisphaera sp. T31B1]|uniref:phytoene desaturase family protein n=1 Tax=Salinisphaera sp. T31B1 TaxID=727963 RepID=UPI00333F233C
MTDQQFDAVVVGGGHNGLVCGTYLARQGHKVCVLERRDIVGGAAVSEAVWPGYRVSTGAYTMALLQPRIIQELDLAREGFEVLVPPPMVHFYDRERYLVLHGDSERLHAELARYSRVDADAYPDYVQTMKAIGEVVSRMLWEIPPDPGSSKLSERVRLARFAWKNRNLGAVFYDVYELMTLSGYDWLKRWFVSDEVITALGFYVACSGAATTLSAPGSAYILLRGFIRDNTTAAGPSGFVRGGMGSISEAIAAAGRRHGLIIRTNAQVRNVILHDGRAQGVVLEDGSEIRARAVVSNVPSKLLFGSMVDAEALDADFTRRVGRIRDRSAAFKINFALRRLPSFTGFEPERSGFAYPAQLRIAPSTRYFEQSFDAAKYGRIAQNPALVLTTPSVVDDSVAPSGRHLMHVFGQHAPYALETGAWDDDARKRLYANAVDTITQYAPDFADCIDDCQVLSPHDIEQHFLLPGGHVHHGELSADQILFNRPVHGSAAYRTPVDGLFQCGASAHPGGGVTGVPGYNAARVVLKALGRSRQRRT